VLVLVLVLVLLYCVRVCERNFAQNFPTRFYPTKSIAIYVKIIIEAYLNKAFVFAIKIRIKINVFKW